MFRRLALFFGSVVMIAATATQAADDLLVNGSFTDWGAAVPGGWTFLEVASEGDGPTSLLLEVPGREPGTSALRLEGDQKTRRWQAAVQTLAATPGDLVELSGWLRTVDVDPGGHPYRNVKVAVLARAAGGQLINMWELQAETGTTPWTRHATTMQIPLGATTLEVMCLLSMSGALEVADLSLVRRDMPVLAPTATRTERWEADLDLLVDLLPDLHPDPFTILSADEFRARAASLRTRIDDLTDEQCNLQLVSLVAALGDAHTSLEFAGGEQRLPWQGQFFGDDLRVVAITEDCADLAGGRVLRLGDMPLADALAAVRTVIPCETESWFRYQAPKYLQRARVGHGLGLSSDPDALTITVVDDAGAEHVGTVRVPVDGERPSFTVRQPETMPLCLSRRDVYWFEYLPAHRAMYLSYLRCREDPAHPMAAFTAELAAALDTLAVDRFILDVRRNTGGSSHLLDPLIRDVAARHARGEIESCYVITGRATFSSACLNTMSFRYQTGAIVVGEPMGNRPNRFGQLNVLTLPGTGLRLQYATKRFVTTEGDPEVLAPDWPVSPSWEQYLSGEDPALMRILAGT